MTRNVISVLSCLACAALCAGCGTVMVRTAAPTARQTMIYPATATDVVMIRSGGMFWQEGGNARKVFGWAVVVPLYIVDLPFSAVIDTVLLPVDLRTKSRIERQTANEFAVYLRERNTRIPHMTLVSTQERQDLAAFKADDLGRILDVREGGILRCPVTGAEYRVVFVGSSYVTLRPVISEN